MLSERIVDTVLDDLHGRKGIGDELDQIKHGPHPDIYEEMREELKAKVVKELEQHHGQ